MIAIAFNVFEIFEQLNRSIECFHRESNPLINNFMRQIQIEGDYAKLESYYIEKYIFAIILDSNNIQNVNQLILTGIIIRNIFCIIMTIYFQNRLIAIVNKLKKNYIVWQEVFDNNVTVSKTCNVYQVI